MRRQLQTLTCPIIVVVATKSMRNNFNKVIQVDKAFRIYDTSVCILHRGFLSHVVMDSIGGRRQQSSYNQDNFEVFRRVLPAVK